MAYKILAIDPGTSKIGVALLDKSGTILYKNILRPDSLLKDLIDIINREKPVAIILGNKTAKSEISKTIREIDKNIKLVEVDEYKSSEEARKRYWCDNPPRGFRRLIPTSLQFPPRPCDDYAAVILAERYLKTIK
ncbi:MAG: Holliday junction resolvase RuvX [bacterium]